MSSGAIAIGSTILGINKRRARLEDLQAAAAAGQVQLAHAYQEALGKGVEDEALLRMKLIDVGGRVASS